MFLSVETWNLICMRFTRPLSSFVYVCHTRIFRNPTQNTKKSDRKIGFDSTEIALIKILAKQIEIFPRLHNRLTLIRFDATRPVLCLAAKLAEPSDKGTHPLSNAHMRGDAINRITYCTKRRHRQGDRRRPN
jgi:hypothetical protein